MKVEVKLAGSISLGRYHQSYNVVSSSDSCLIRIVVQYQACLRFRFFKTRLVISRKHDINIIIMINTTTRDEGIDLFVLADVMLFAI